MRRALLAGRCLASDWPFWLASVARARSCGGCKFSSFADGWLVSNCVGSVEIWLVCGAVGVSRLAIGSISIQTVARLAGCCGVLGCVVAGRLLAFVLGEWAGFLWRVARVRRVGRECGESWVVDWGSGGSAGRFRPRLVLSVPG